MAEAGKRRFFYGYVIVVAALVIWVICWGTHQSFGIFFKPMSEELVWTRAMTSGAFSVSAIVMALSGVVTGRLSDRFGPRVVITTGVAFLGIGYLLMSQISAVWQLYLFWGLVAGVGMSVVGPALMSTVSRWFVKRRGLMIAIVVTGAGIGGVILPLIGAWLTLTYDWRFAWIILGIIALIFMVSSSLLFRRDPAQLGQLPDGAEEVRRQEEGKQAQNLPETGLILSQAIRTRHFWILSVILLCFGLNRGIMVHIAPHVTDIGFSLTTAASVLAANSGVSIIGRLVMGHVADMIGGRRSLIITFILMPAAFLVIAASKEIWALYLFAILFGFAWGGIAVLRFSIAGELFGVSSLGAIMGIVELFATVGSGITPYVAGWLFDMMGSYLLSFLIFAAIGMLGFVMSWFLKPVTKKSITPEENMINPAAPRAWR